MRLVIGYCVCMEFSVGLDWIGGCILFMEACNTDGDFNSWWAFQEGMCTRQLQISLIRGYPPSTCFAIVCLNIKSSRSKRLFVGTMAEASKVIRDRFPSFVITRLKGFQIDARSQIGSIKR